MQNSKRVAIVGAGIAGLTCAYELQQQGFDVTVYERNTRVGGRMASRTDDGFIFDIGADHLCNLYVEMKKYCVDFGITWEKMRFLKYALVKNAKVVTFDEALSRTSKFRLAVQFFVSRNLEDFLNLESVVKHDTEDAYTYMRRWAGKEVGDYVVDAFTSTYQFHRAKEISKGALLGILRSVSRDQEGWDLHRTKGGMQALPDAFASRLKNLKTGTAIQGVKGGEKPAVVEQDGSETSYDAVVLAAQAPASLSLYKNPTEPQRSLLERSKYATTISVAFRVDRSRLPDIAIVWVPYVESSKISGYVNEAMKGEETTHDGKSLISTWLHEEFAKTLMGKSNEEIFAAVKTELVRVCPWVSSTRDLDDLDLQRWPEAMPKFEHGHPKAVHHFMQKEQGERGVFLCGDYLNSPWTEGALRCGQRVAKQVSQRLA